MRIDPSLMRNEAYLAPYPAIAAFLQQHPDIVQNPNYYLEHVNYEMWNPRQPEDARAASIRAFQEMMQAIAVLLGLGAAGVRGRLDHLDAGELPPVVPDLEGADRGAHQAAGPVHARTKT